MGGQADQWIDLVELGARDVGERILLPVDHALLQRDVELAEGDLLCSGTEGAEDVDRYRVRRRADLQPLQILGLTIGRLLLVT